MSSWQEVRSPNNTVGMAHLGDLCQRSTIPFNAGWEAVVLACLLTIIFAKTSKTWDSDWPPLVNPTSRCSNWKLRWRSFVRWCFFKVDDLGHRVNLSFNDYIDMNMSKLRFLNRDVLREFVLLRWHDRQHRTHSLMSVFILGESDCFRGCSTAHICHSVKCMEYFPLKNFRNVRSSYERWN